MTTAAPPDPTTVSLAVARNAHAADTLHELQRILVQDCRLLAPFDHCALVLRSGQGVRLSAIGHQGSGHDDGRLTAVAEHIAPVVADRDRILVVSTEGTTAGLAETDARTLRTELDRAGLRCLVALPIAHRHQRLGAMVLLYGETPPPSAKDLEPLARVLPILGAALRAHLDTGSTTTATRPPGRRRRALIWIAAIAALLALPVPFRVGGPVELTSRREHNVWVELGGTVAGVRASSGEWVDRGQTIARLDDRDLEFEIDGKQRQLEQLEAELEILRNLAADDAAKVADFRLAELHAERAIAELEHLRSLRSRLDLVAPVRGLVADTGLDGVLGRRFAAGEILCRIAPTDDMEFALRVPERDLEFVVDAERMHVVMSADPADTIDAPIRRVDPIATVDPEHGNGFVVRAPHADAEHLRPGMTGTGYVSVGWRPLGYVLFRKPVARAYQLLLGL
ncbi:MAG: efflux RND transporter periplasmic adaptor subunit [Planctomycetes bacterium]|nr:efflux RND transporter periplasmic adaptor subunit [Planctomycetota bacterium]